MTSIIFSTLLLMSCGSSNSSKSRQAKLGDRLLEDPEHYIKDSPEITKHDSTILYTGWYYVIDTDNGYKRKLYKSEDTFFIARYPIVTASNFTKLEIYESNAGGKKYFGLTIRLDKRGTENWSIATEKSIGKELAFILDNRLLQVAKVNSQITAGVTALNRGDFSAEELGDIKNVIESEE